MHDRKLAVTEPHGAGSASRGWPKHPEVEGELRTLVMRFLVASPAQLPPLVLTVERAQAWATVIKLCERWHVLPPLAARLEACGHPLPQPEAARLRQVAAQQFVTTSLRLRGGCTALHALEAGGVEAAAFKGFAVLALLHGGRMTRTIQDVDILVRREDASRAVEVLQARGYRPKLGPVPLDEYLAFVRDSPGAAGNEAISLAGRDGTDIDLHWKLGRFDTDRLLEEAERVPLFSDVVPVLPPAVGLLMTAHHAVRNDFVPDTMARDLLDAQGWFQLFQGAAASQHSLASTASNHGMKDAIRALGLILDRLGGGHATDGGPASGAARRLEALYFRQLAYGPINTDLPYVLSSTALRQFLRGAWRDWRRYQEMMRAFESANGESSLPLAVRVARLAASAWRTAPAHWSQLRTLARLKDQIS